MKVLILGASGLIGSGVKKTLDKISGYNVIGTYNNKLMDGNNFLKLNNLEDNHIKIFIEKINPDLIINCLGITKHLSSEFNDNEHIKVNAIFPKELSNIAYMNNIKFVHISTDCIYSGEKGNYIENDVSDAKDIYGVSKAMGENIHPSSTILRTSTIGREIITKYGLLEWFLSQENECEGHQNAIFSGITSIELGKVIQNFIIPNKELNGLYNVSSDPINKYELLKKLAIFYKKDIKINKNKTFKIDRSLSGDLFKAKFGYEAKTWDLMLSEMNK